MSIIVNNVQLAHPIITPVHWQAGFSISRGLSANISFLPLCHLTWLSPNVLHKTKHRIPFFRLFSQAPQKFSLHRLMKMPMSFSLLLFSRPQKKGKKWNNSENTIKNCCTTFFQTMWHNISLHNKPRKMM